MQSTDEALDLLREQWRRSTAGCKVCAAPIDRKTRSEVVEFMALLYDHDRLYMSLPQLVHAIALLDILCDQVLDTDQISWLPGACAAACELVMKFDQAGARVELWELSNARACLARKLSKRYELQDDIVAKPFHMQESQVVQRLSWRIDVPTVVTWQSAFSERLDMATDGIFHPQLLWIQKMGARLTRFALLRMTTLELQPEHFARGAFCFGLVTASLVPDDWLFPDEEIGLLLEEWEDILGKGLRSQDSYPTCILRPDAEERMRGLLEQALAVEFGALRRDAALFVKLMRTARGSATEKRP